MSGDASDCLGSHFCLPPSLKGRSLQMTSNSSGRTSFIRLSTSQPGVKRRWRSSEKLAANMERDTGMLSPKKSGWVEGGGLNLFSFCHCTHFFFITFCLCSSDGKDSLHVSPDVPALCLEDSETQQVDP